jgi:excisionase family DNA binding protein
MRKRQRIKNAARARTQQAKQRLTAITARAFNPPEFARRNGIGLDKTYKEIREGRLRAHKAGRRTLIFDTDEQAWREALPRLELT